MEWTYHYWNYGHSPASNILFWEYIKIGNRKFVPSYKKQLPGVSGPLPPNMDNFSTVASTPDITDEEFKEIAAKDNMIQIWIRITYTDMDGSTKGKTSFCSNMLHDGGIFFCGGKEKNYMR